MAMSNVERQRKWMEKNRGLHNLRRRKKGTGPPKVADAPCSTSTILQIRTEIGVGSNAAPTVQSAGAAKEKKLEELRELIKGASVEPVKAVVRGPRVYRDNFGRVISEGAWKHLEGLKAKAKAGGHEIDEWSQ